MKRRTKQVIAVVVVLAVLLALAYFGQSDRSMRFGTARIGGVYYTFGKELKEILSSEGVKLNIKETAGSAANLRLLSGNTIQLAIAQTDVLYDAWTGTALFEGEKLQGYSAVAGLYTEACQIVTAADSGIQSIRDLQGKKISIGEKESGTEQNAKQILLAYELTEDMLEEVSMNYSEAAEALEKGEIDAFFYTGGAQSAMVDELAQKIGLRLLSVDDREKENLLASYQYYFPCTIPAGTYLGQDTDVETIGVRPVLLVSDKVEKDVVRKITKALYQHVQELQAGIPTELSLSEEEIPVPLHKGAEEYYNSVRSS